MKTPFLKSAFSSLALLFSLVLAPVLSAVESGQPAPSFTLTDVDGKSHSLSDYKGKIVILEWVNPECPFVKHHYQGTGNMPALQRQAKADGAVWLSINSGGKGKQGDFSLEQVKAWMTLTGATPAAYLRDQDGKVGKLYAAKTTPHMYVISAEGTLVYQGAIDDSRDLNAASTKSATNFVTAALASLRAGKPVQVTSKPSYGCGVKY
jgi:hypothetical protein